jgi:hypothetical protein
MTVPNLAASVMTSQARAVLANQFFTVRHLGNGCVGWDRYSEDKEHYALITDDSGMRLGDDVANPATAIWLVGVYSHDGYAYSRCEQIVGLDAAITRALEMLKSPHRHLRHQHLRKWFG